MYTTASWRCTEELRWVTRQRGQADNPRFITPVIRQGKRIMIWGAISYGRRYPLVKIDLSNSKLNGQRYLDEILRPHLAKHLNSLQRYGQRHAMVIEEGAPLHWRKSLQSARAQLKIVNFPHPAYSPDLNPIENMWSILKAKIRQRKRIPSSEDALWEAIQAEWAAIPIRTINKLIMGMPKRVEKLRKSRGWSIAY